MDTIKNGDTVLIMDIGTGSVRGKLVKYHDTHPKVVSSSQSMEPHWATRNSIFDELAEDALKKMLRKMLMDTCPDGQPDHIYAFGTASFRNALNGSELFKNVIIDDHHQLFGEASRSKSRIISQEEEAFFGYLTALRCTKENATEKEKIVAFDFGGGSFQFSNETSTYGENIGMRKIYVEFFHKVRGDTSVTISDAQASPAGVCPVKPEELHAFREVIRKFLPPLIPEAKALIEECDGHVVMIDGRGSLGYRGYFAAKHLGLLSDMQLKQKCFDRRHLEDERVIDLYANKTIHELEALGAPYPRFSPILVIALHELMVQYDIKTMQVFEEHTGLTPGMLHHLLTETTKT